MVSGDDVVVLQRFVPSLETMSRGAVFLLAATKRDDEKIRTKTGELENEVLICLYRKIMIIWLLIQHIHIGAF